METFAFYFLAISITILFAITVWSKNILNAMTALAAGMILISGLFFILGADFLGAVQLIVYVGAVMALYAFGMMFFDATSDVKEKNRPNFTVSLLGVLTAILLVVIFTAPAILHGVPSFYPEMAGATNPQAVGLVLFTKYLVPFEVAAIMLLVAMIAGIILAGKKMDKSISRMSEEELKADREKDSK